MICQRNSYKIFREILIYFFVNTEYPSEYRCKLLFLCSNTPV